MADDIRIKELLDNLESHQTPEDVCGNDRELLREVRARWDRIRHVKNQLDEFFPQEEGASTWKESFASPHELPRIAGYEIEGVLGRGGMGVVFRARHLRLGRTVAIKMLLAGAYAGPTELARFQLEAEAVAGLCHANVVQIHEVGDHEGRPYFTMEFVDGGSLAQKLAATPPANAGGSQRAEASQRAGGAQARSGGSQSVRWAAELVASLAEAVSVAHHAGIIHRDLKPGNILLTANGTPKISDFGLARRLKGGGDLTWTGAAIGTPSYMAPEQASDKAGPIGPATDVYGLGAVLYELLTGRPPFRAGTALETLRQVLSEEPAPPSRLNPRVPKDLETVCLKCLHKDPKRRYTSAAALAEDLRRYLLGQVVTARPVSPLERAVKWVRRNKWVAGLSAAAVFALLAGSGIALAIRNHFQEQNQADHAAGLVKQLLAAKIDKVPPIIKEIEGYRVWADPWLREENDRAGAGSPQKLHASLALLPVDPGQTLYLYDRLLDADPHEVPVITDTLAPHKQELLEKLWSVVENPGKGKEQRLRAASALASFDPQSDRWVKQSPGIVNLVLEDPFSLGPWRESFRPVKNSFLEPLAALLRNHSPERNIERIFATNLLADYAADRPDVLVDLLMDADAKQFALIYPLVEKNKDRCIAALAGEIDKQAEALAAPKKKVILEANGVIARDDPEVKVSLFMSRPGKRFDVPMQSGNNYQMVMESKEFSSSLMLRDKTDKVLTFYSRIGGGLDSLLHYTPATDDTYKVIAFALNKTGSFRLRIVETDFRSDDSKEKLAKRQANAAVALVRLKQETRVWPLLARRQEPDDPRVRSYLIHRLGPLGADAALIFKRLEEEKDITIRRALVLSLGEYGDKELPPQSRDPYVQKLRTIYAEDADAGLHAATEWLLRHWQDEAWLRQVNDAWTRDKDAQEKRLKSIKQHMEANRAAPAPGAAQWYVNGQGQTMVAIPDPGKPFLMGSPLTEPDRADIERQHKKRIARTFAIAATPVTIGQYKKFAGAYMYPTLLTFHEDRPVVFTRWVDAAAYCNWLSKEEGIDPKEWCYETDPAGKTGLKVPVVRLRANYLTLRGYRLPTEAEIEYATRAGAVTSRYFGETDELLPKYAWYLKNAKRQTMPVGLLKPNDFGLFDMQGNVFTWCQESYKEYPRDGGDDKEGTLVIPNKGIRIMRGGTWASEAGQLRSAYRAPFLSDAWEPYIGFRVARTLSLDPAATLPIISPKASPHQDGTIVLDKKDSLTEKDSVWIPSNPTGILKLVSGNPHKVYTLRLMKGDTILIRLKSIAMKIDPLVALEDSRNNLIAYNDDDGANKVLDSRLVVTIPEDGEYRVIATCVHLFRNKHGDFHLTVEKTSTIPRADTRAEPFDKAKLVGTWEFVKSTEKKSPPAGSMIEFTRDGKLKISTQAGKQSITIEGTYSVDGGDTLKIETGKNDTDTMRIIRLTDKELVTAPPDETGTTELRKK